MEAEDEIVRNNSIDAAAAQLKRTRIAILMRRRVLGVRQIVRRGWSPEQDALLKKFNVAQAAERLGRTLSSVENRRARLRICVPHPSGRRFTPEEDALLGTAPDAVIAKRLGRHPSSVQGRRLKLGLAFWRNRKKRPWTPEEEALLGTASDTEVAARLGRHISTVCIRRQQLGIPNSYWQERCGRQRSMGARRSLSASPAGLGPSVGTL
jgi:hypothetical protein